MERTRLIRLPEVSARTGLTKSGIYKAIREGRFPRPVPIGSHAVAWVEHEVDRWVQACCAARAASLSPSR